MTIILLIFLSAMHFGGEVNWNRLDFLLAAILLLGSGFLVLFFLKRIKNPKYRALIIFAIVVLLLLFWAELGVGIFGTPLSGD